MRTIGVTAGATEPAFAIWRAVEHVLQAIAQRADVPRIVLHLVARTPSYLAVAIAIAVSDSGLAEGGERRLPGFERA